MPTNTLITPTWVTKDTARGFVNKLNFLKNTNRQYDSQYEQGGAKVGNTVNARMPNRFYAADGEGMVLQALYDQTVPITLNHRKHVATTYSSAQATTEIDEIRQRYTNPAAEALASVADATTFAGVYRDVYNMVGTIGTTPSTTLAYLQAGTKLTDSATPLDGRIAMLDPLAMQTIANTASTLFNPTGYVSDSTREGMFSQKLLGIDKWMQDPVRPTFTSGTFTACTPLVDGAGQTGSTINVNGWASGATNLKKGDILTFAGTTGVNPLSYTGTGRLLQFVLTADTSDASGVTATLPISPSIITSGQLQTVNASPADDAVVLVWSTASGGALATTTSPQSLVYHPDAFAVVWADLAMPNGGATGKRISSKALGLSMRYVEQYQIATDQNPNRIDILFGEATLQARLACRVVG